MAEELALGPALPAVEGLEMPVAGRTEEQAWLVEGGEQPQKDGSSRLRVSDLHVAFRSSHDAGVLETVADPGASLVGTDGCPAARGSPRLRVSSLPICYLAHH